MARSHVLGLLFSGGSAPYYLGKYLHDRLNPAHVRGQSHAPHATVAVSVRLASTGSPDVASVASTSSSSLPASTIVGWAASLAGLQSFQSAKLRENTPSSGNLQEISDVHVS